MNLGEYTIPISCACNSKVEYGSFKPEMKVQFFPGAFCQLQERNRMNTPEPCDKCGNFYYDCMTVETPNNYTKCMDRSGEAKWGEKDCPQFTTENGGIVGYKTFIVQYKNGSGDWIQVEKSDTSEKEDAIYLARKMGNSRVIQISYNMGKETKVLIDHKSRQMGML